MASGVLGQQALNATTNTTVYTTPADTVAYANINVVNTNATPITVRLALAASGTPLAAEYIEYDAEIAGYGVLERTGVVLNSKKSCSIQQPDRRERCSIWCRRDNCLINNIYKEHINQWDVLLVHQQNQGQP